MSGYRSAGRCLLAVLAAMVFAACVKVPQQTDNMSRAGIEHLTATQLRELVLQYAGEFTQAVEHTADSIATVSDDPVVRRRLLLWKLVTVRSVREAALISDPLFGLVDVWLFAAQSRQFLEDPPPESNMVPNEFVAIALDVVRQQELEARQLAVNVAGAARVDRFEPQLLEFAMRNPIDPLTFERTSILAADSLVMRPMGGGIGAAMAATYWGMRELDDRLEAINSALGKELRWNIELLARDMAALPVVDSTLQSLTASLERFAVLADTLPSLVGSERAAVLEALHAELAALTDAIDAMRRETLDAVSSERMAVLEAITQERLAVLEAVSAERMATLATVDSLLTRAMDRSEQVVDHLIWRMVQVGLVAGVLVFAAVLITLRLRRPTIS